MRLDWQPRALKDLARLDERMQQRIITAMERFASTGQGDVVRLTDVQPPEFRLRVGDWRVRFTQDPASRTIFVLRVLPRDKAYG